MRRALPTQWSWAVAAAFTAAAGTACGDDALEPSSQPVATVEVIPATATVAVGTTASFTATALDADGKPVTGRKVLWVSADSNFATISDDGVVTGKYVGTVPVAASVDGKTATAQVVVIPVPVVAVRISPIEPRPHRGRDRAADRGTARRPRRRPGRTRSVVDDQSA